MDKRNKLPQWINLGISEGNTNMSTDMAIASAKKFLRDIAQPFDFQQQVGSLLLSEEDLRRRAATATVVEHTEADMSLV